MTINEMQKIKFYEQGRVLPNCINIGCKNKSAVRNWGNWSFKSECSRCQTDRKKGTIRNHITIHKKKYCENIDRHLGFECPIGVEYKFKGFEQSLDLDHLDGDHMNNIPSNVKTYCKMCHGRKTTDNKDCSNSKNSSRKFN